MKLEIYEPEKVEKKEEPVRLKLVSYGNMVRLNVVNEKGNWVISLLGIYQNGTIKFYSGVRKDLGFQLDENCCVKLEKE